MSCWSCSFRLSFLLHTFIQCNSILTELAKVSYSWRARFTRILEQYGLGGIEHCDSTQEREKFPYEKLSKTTMDGATAARVKFKIILQIFGWTFTHIFLVLKANLYFSFSSRLSKKNCVRVFLTSINCSWIKKYAFELSFLLNWIGLKVWNLLPSKTKTSENPHLHNWTRKEEERWRKVLPPLNLCFMGGADAVFLFEEGIPHGASSKVKLSSDSKRLKKIAEFSTFILNKIRHETLPPFSF